jgi:cell wall-associated NlpC family hydrolase
MSGLVGRAALKPLVLAPIAVLDMSKRTLLHILALMAVGLAASLALAAPALAKSYSDVKKSHWAYGSISAVTDRTVKGYRLLDDYQTRFRPERAITRELLARSVVLASGHYGRQYQPVEIKDVPKGYRYYTVIQLAVRQGYMGLDKEGNFRPTDKVTSAAAETVIVRWLRDRYSSHDWSLLSGLVPKRWRPNPGWATGAPSYLPSLVASRQLELRYNHPSSSDGHETLPKEPIDRAEIAYMFDRAFKVSSGWQLYGLADFKDISFPALSDRQKQIVRFSLKYIGYPYVWAGEYPTPNSPYGYQKSGGFDCSGFVFYVMKMHFGYPITVNERGAGDMAARAKPRLKRSQLTCGDLIFFGPKGPSSSVGSIYHAGLYLGRGWFIHSTGSSDGVQLASLNHSSYYQKNFAWGRRVLKKAELEIPAPSSSPTASGAPAAAETPAPQASTASPIATASPPSASPAPVQP